MLLQQRPYVHGGVRGQGQPHRAYSTGRPALASRVPAQYSLDAPAHAAHPSPRLVTGAPSVRSVAPGHRTSLLTTRAVAKACSPTPSGDDDEDIFNLLGIGNNILPIPASLGNNAVPFPGKTATKGTGRLRRTPELLEMQPAVYWQSVDDMLQAKMDRILLEESNLRVERCQPTEDGSLHPADDLPRAEKCTCAGMLYAYYTNNDTARRGQVKVGRTAVSWAKRSQQHRNNCDHEPLLLVAWVVWFDNPRAAAGQAPEVVLERHMLAALKPLRDRTPCASVACGTRHLEWFRGFEQDSSIAPQLVRGRHTLVVASAA